MKSVKLGYSNLGIRKYSQCLAFHPLAGALSRVSPLNGSGFFYNFTAVGCSGQVKED
ncbi:MAG: hypothetical protein QXR19_11775 [Candidatus Jordarchaeaceae archaeon]